MPDLSRFTLSDMSVSSSALRRLGEGVASMEQVAERIVRHLHEELVDAETGEKCCALIRFFKTHPWQELPRDLQEFASGLLGHEPESPQMKCLTLLATAGEKPEWNSRRDSLGHRAIPLPSEEMVKRFPMISQLIHQFGLEIGSLLEPDTSLMVDLDQRSYNVFHVAEAPGSPNIPAQEEFVIPWGIRSALGFGGMLPGGDLFAIILFARVTIARETAEMFRTLALSAKVAVLPFVGGRLLEEKDTT